MLDLFNIVYFIFWIYTIIKNISIHEKYTYILIQLYEITYLIYRLMLKNKLRKLIINK
jgi:hypothetical protein